MTAPTKTRSAYPPDVQKLLPAARALTKQLGGLPSQNRLRAHLKVGGPKASLVLDALRQSRGITPADPEPPTQTPEALKDAEPGEPLTKLNADAVTSEPVLPTEQSSAPALPVEPPSGPENAEREPAALVVTEPAEAVADTSPRQEPPTVEPVTASLAAPVKDEPAMRRPVRSGAVVALVASGVAVVTGAVWAARTSFDAVQAWPWPSVVAAGLAAVTVVLVLAWSLTSVAGAVLAGRTSRDLALDIASWTVAGVAGFLAAYGQVAFAVWAGVTGWERFLVPGILEPSVVVLLLLANRRVHRRRAGQPAKPIGKLLALAALLGAFAVYTNVVHAGGMSGLVFGAATVVGLILWWVKLQDDAAPDDWDDAPHSARLSRRTAKYRLVRWVILPGQTRRAWLISLDHSVNDAEQGLDLARQWQRAYDESREAKKPRRIARQHASRHIDAVLTSAN